MGGSLEDLVKRFRDLEVSQARLRDQLQSILGEGRRLHAHGQRGGGELGGVIPGRFAYGPYRNVLKHIGHALHIYRPDTGEITFWNRSAEYLYGWKDHEALGKRVGDLLVHEENNPCLGRVMEQLNKGQSWSGQLAFKKRSGEILMAMVTKSPLCEEGALIGVITVSSDTAQLHNKCSDMLGGCGDQVHGQQPRACKRVQWGQGPQIASSVSNLALKVFSRSRSCSDSEHEASQEGNVKPKKEVPALETVFMMQARKRGIEEKSCKREETISKFNKAKNVHRVCLDAEKYSYVVPLHRSFLIQKTICFQQSDEGI